MLKSLPLRGPFACALVAACLAACQFKPQRIVFDYGSADTASPAFKTAHDGCQFEAVRATAAIRNARDKVLERTLVYATCMDARGYRTTRKIVSE